MIVTVCMVSEYKADHPPVLAEHYFLQALSSSHLVEKGCILSANEPAKPLLASKQNYETNDC